MANEKKYVVTHLYQEYGGRATSSVIGTFSTPENARKALENDFHDTCDRLGVEELNAVSYQDEDDFCIQDENDLYVATGTITEVFEDMEYEADSDEFLETEEENNAKPVGEPQLVASMAQLLGVIDRNIDERGGEPVEIIIQLNFGAVTRKSITYADELDETGRHKFEVYNHIDDTTQILTFDELFDRNKTLIGEAVVRGALYMVLD